MTSDYETLNATPIELGKVLGEIGNIVSDSGVVNGAEADGLIPC